MTSRGGRGERSSRKETEAVDWVEGGGKGSEGGDRGQTRGHMGEAVEEMLRRTGTRETQEQRR